MAPHYKSINLYGSTKQNDDENNSNRSQSVYSSFGMMRPGILRLNQKFSPNVGAVILS